MIDRYTSPEMEKIWSLETQYQCWLEVEIAADEAWSKLGHIPAADVEKIKKHAKFTVDGIAKIVGSLRHNFDWFCWYWPRVTIEEGQRHFA